MAKLRFTITMSLDGYVAGPGQSLDVAHYAYVRKDGA